MTPPIAEPNSSTSRGAADRASGGDAPAEADDFAIGCECADPSLQIEGWMREATAQPLQDFH